MTTTPNPTAEQVVAEAMVNAGAPLMHSRVEEAVVAALRAHGLLSEGAPSEEQIERAARALAGIEPGEDWPTNAELGGSLTGTRDDEYRDGMREMARAALTAAGVAPQEPNVLAGRCRTCGGEVLEGTAEDVIDFLDNSSPDREKLIAEARKFLFSDSEYGYEYTMEGDLIYRLVDALEDAETRLAALTQPPAYLALDLWQALQLPVNGFDDYFERNGWADTWSNLLHETRVRSGEKPCGNNDDGEPCVLLGRDHLIHYGASDVGSSEALPNAAALGGESRGV